VARRGRELKRGRGGACGGRPQIREKHKRALSEEELEVFLTTLAATCNVSAAARAAARHSRTFYDLRRRDGTFRACWMQALREGYDHLELALLERARFGASKDVFHQGVKTGTTRIFTDGTSMRLLHQHRASVEAERNADSGGRERDGETVLDELVRRLNQVRASGVAESGDEPAS
jgi:hypothetical protein